MCIMKKPLAFICRLLLLAVSCLAVAGYAADSVYERMWPDTDFSNRVVELREIRGGGPPKDGIPAIDMPRFDRVADAFSWIDPMEPVIAVTIGSQTRAYPLQILTYHEIVNDALGGKAISVTFCPLCNASIVFDRAIEGEVLDFGTTGLLRMSDLIMYDRQTESWWQQFSGRAIVGEFAGTRLTRVPSSIVSFASFASAFPDAEVLNRDTGHARPYGRNPYPGYDRIDQRPFLFDRSMDSRLPPMERILSVTVGGRSRIYPFSALSNNLLIHDEFDGVPVVVFAAGELLSVLDDRSIADSRTVLEAVAWERRIPSYPGVLSFSMEEGAIRDMQTGSLWNVFGEATDGRLKGARLPVLDSGIHFAFAWLAFNPQTEIWTGKQDG